MPEVDLPAGGIGLATLDYTFDVSKRVGASHSTVVRKVDLCKAGERAANYSHSLEVSSNTSVVTGKLTMKRSNQEGDASKIQPSKKSGRFDDTPSRLNEDDLRHTTTKRSRPADLQMGQVSPSKRPCFVPNYLDNCNESELESLSKLTPIKIIRSTKICKGLEDFLSYGGRHSNDRLSLIVILLAKLCNLVFTLQPSTLKDQAKTTLSNLELIDYSRFSFWAEVSLCIRVAPYSKFHYVRKCDFMSSIHTIMTAILNGTLLFPNVQQIISLLPIDDFHGALRQLCDDSSSYKPLYEQSLHLIHKRDKLRSQESCRNDTYDWHRYVVLPGRDDLLCKSLPADLRKNQDVYSSNKEYLEIHLNLLREDFIHPLRCVLHDLKEQFSEDYEEDSNDIHVIVYNNVQFFRKDVCGGELVYKLKFSLPKNCKVNWDHSKRFTFGSIVCISDDNFDTFLYATVANRDVSELKRNIVMLKLLDISQQRLMKEPIRCKNRYQMIESPAYFKAYSSIVDQLHSMSQEPDNLPALVERYMVKGDTKSKHLPLYLQESENRSMNLKGVLCICRSEEECVHENENIDVTQKFNNADPNLTLDESQIDALHLAMSSEISLIQGPPGTGKTFVGAQLMKALLLNRYVWNPERTVPILVMCQTNHALDQFLEEILDLGITEKIVRIGGRSKSERICNKKMRLKDRKYEIRGENREMRRRSKQSRKDLILGGTSFRKENLVAAESIVEALEELCCGVPYNELNERLYCSFLSPEELSNPEYSRISDRIGFHEDVFPERAILQWFGIKTIDHRPQEHNEQRRNKIHYDAEAAEDDRRIEDDPTTTTLFEGTNIFLFAKNKQDFKKFFERLQRAQASSGRRGDLRIDQKIDLLKTCMRDRLRILYDDIEILKRQKEDFEEEDEEITLKALRRADVVGVTTTGASINTKILQKLRCKIVIVEEAAEVMEAHILAALSKHTQQLVLIGDHKQLRPKANNFIIGRKYGLEISLFERLIKNDLPSVQLKYQHRMRPEIADLVRPHIYKELFDHEKVKTYEPIQGMKTSLFFVDHSLPEKNFEGLISPSNKHEASFIMHLADYLLHQGYQPDQITVLTPYSGQVAALKEEMNTSKVQPLRIVPVDNFQGEENDIILLSLVRSVKSRFVKAENRICVALSRAKKGLYVIGNFSNLFTRESKTWNNIVENLKKTEQFGTALPLQCSLHGKVTEIVSIDDFKLVKDGGCAQQCETRLPCGHICSRSCHPDDQDHKAVCKKPCNRKCPQGHKCPQQCYEPCPPCNDLVPKVIPNCEHVQLVPCNLDPCDFICQEDCQVILPCGHKCQKSCGDLCTMECQALLMKSLPCGHDVQTECYRSPTDQMIMCKIPCNTVLACGHKCQGTCGRCHQGRLHNPCQMKCDRVLFCGHTCSSNNCAQDCPPCQKNCLSVCSHGSCGHKCESLCIECAEPCEWKCPHYKCTKSCGELCDRLRCDEPCKLQLKCGHYCLGLCGEPCPPLCRECDPQNEAFNTFFGNEDEPSSRFILLPCQHIIEVSGLDQWMDTKSDEIQWKGCPHCKKPIMCPRYGNVIKEIKKDMNLIKEKELQKLPDGDRRQIELEIHQWNEKFHFCRDLDNLSDVTLQSLHTRLCAANECEKLISFFSSISSKPKRLRLTHQSKMLQNYLTSNRVRQLSCLPQQVSSDIHCERRRLCLLMKLYRVHDAAKASHANLSVQDQQYLRHMILKLNPRNHKPLDRITEEELFLNESKRIADIWTTYNLGPPTKEEMRAIVKAIRGKKGSWYKCPNGHVYNIGECGGAMERGKCIECGAEVGGSSHRLLDSNTHAGEMDQSQFAAWGEQANMLNYELPPEQ